MGYSGPAVLPGKVREQQEDSAQNKTKTLGLTQVWGDETLAEQEVATDSSEGATQSSSPPRQKGGGEHLEAELGVLGMEGIPHSPLLSLGAWQTWGQMSPGTHSPKTCPCKQKPKAQNSVKSLVLRTLPDLVIICRLWCNARVTVD